MEQRENKLSVTMLNITEKAQEFIKKTHLSEVFKTQNGWSCNDSIFRVVSKGYRRLFENPQTIPI